VGTSVNVGRSVGDKSVGLSVSEAVVEVIHEVSDILIKRIIALNQIIICFILILKLFYSPKINIFTQTLSMQNYNRYEAADYII
jgi:hypothetical protein